MSKRPNTDEALRELIAFIDKSICEVPSYIKKYLTLDPNTDELEILEKEEEYLEKRIDEVKNRTTYLRAELQKSDYLRSGMF